HSIVQVLVVYVRHLLLVGGHPEAAARQILDIGGQLRRELDPEVLRVLRERELRRRIVHHGYVSHAGGRCAAADRSGLDDYHFQLRGRTLGGARSAHDAGARDGYVEAIAHERRIPWQNGSRSSRIRSASAFTYA